MKVKVYLHDILRFGEASAPKRNNKFRPNSDSYLAHQLSNVS